MRQDLQNKHDLTPCANNPLQSGLGHQFITCLGISDHRSHIYTEPEQTTLGRAGLDYKISKARATMVIFSLS